jgi:hypothetical protein
MDGTVGVSKSTVINQALYTTSAAIREIQAPAWPSSRRPQPARGSLQANSKVVQMVMKQETPLAVAV